YLSGRYTAGPPLESCGPLSSAAAAQPRPVKSARIASGLHQEAQVVFMVVSLETSYFPPRSQTAVSFPLVPKLLFGNESSRNSGFGFRTGPGNRVSKTAFPNRSLGTRK